MPLALVTAKHILLKKYMTNCLLNIQKHAAPHLKLYFILKETPL
jgi:hypothetical protein